MFLLCRNFLQCKTPFRTANFLAPEGRSCIISIIERRHAGLARVRKRTSRFAGRTASQAPSLSRCLLHPPPLVDSNPSSWLGFFFAFPHPSTSRRHPAAPIEVPPPSPGTCRLDAEPRLCLCLRQKRQYNRGLFRHARGKGIQGEPAHTSRRRPGPEDRPTAPAPISDHKQGGARHVTGSSTSLRKNHEDLFRQACRGKARLVRD